MIVFVSSLRHPATSVDYTRVENLLRDTLASICSQDSDKYRVIVVGHVRPSFELPPKVDFITVDFPPPPLTNGRVSRPDLRIDKGRKLAIAAAYAKRFAPTHIAPFDSDDFISRRIVSHVTAENPRISWFISHGYSLSLSSGSFAWEDGLHHKNGTTLIHSIDQLVIPDVDADDHAAVAAATGEAYFIQHYGSHRGSFAALKASGSPLRALPFPGTIYVLGTGENQGTNRVPRDRCPSFDVDAIAAEFSLPEHVRALLAKREQPESETRVAQRAELAKTIDRADQFIKRGMDAELERLILRCQRSMMKHVLVPLMRAMKTIAEQQPASAWPVLRPHVGGELSRIRPDSFLAAAFAVSGETGDAVFARLAADRASWSAVSQWRAARVLLENGRERDFAELRNAVSGRSDAPGWVKRQVLLEGRRSALATAEA